MEANDLKKLRQLYRSIVGQMKVFQGLTTTVVSGKVVAVLEDELMQLAKEFPNVAPAFNKNRYYSHNSTSGDIIYDNTAIKAHIAMVLGRLEIEIEQNNENPITEQREFAFIKDAFIRNIIERDYAEIQKAYIAGCYKSVLILCGGAIEAILTDLLLQNETIAKTAKAAPPKKPDIKLWDLSNLIEVAVELSLVSSSVEKLSHSIREYRNLVHPGNEVTHKLSFSTEEAKISIEVLNMMHRDLTK